jgi:hypothetical protein
VESLHLTVQDDSGSMDLTVLLLVQKIQSQSSKCVILCCTGDNAEPLLVCASKFGIHILLSYKNLFVCYGMLACHRIDHGQLGGVRSIRFVPLGE